MPRCGARPASVSPRVGAGPTDSGGGAGCRFTHKYTGLLLHHTEVPTIAFAGLELGLLPFTGPTVHPAISFCTPRRGSVNSPFSRQPLSACSGPLQLSYTQHRCRVINLWLWLCLQSYKTIHCPYHPVAHHCEPLTPMHWYWQSTVVTTNIHHLLPRTFSYQIC